MNACRTLEVTKNGLRCVKCGLAFAVSIGDGTATHQCTCGSRYIFKGDFLDTFDAVGGGDFQTDHEPGWDVGADLLGEKNFGVNQLDRDYAPKLIQTMFRLLPEGSRGPILDVGMGMVTKGRLRAHFTNVASAFSEYVGLEPAKEQFAYPLEPDRRRFFFVRGVGESIPYQDAYFDACVILSVLDHCTDDRRVLSEIARVVRPGGVVAISLNNDRSWFKCLLKRRAERARQRAAKEHNYFYSIERLRELLQNDFIVREWRCSRYLPVGYATRSRLVGIPWLLFLKAIDAIGRIAMPEHGGNFIVFAERRGRER